jgi:hypothetical protein
MPRATTKRVSTGHLDQLGACSGIAIMLASRHRVLQLILGLAALALPLVVSSTASAQLEGRPVAQPYFDFPNWARWANCRPHPLMWQFDPFVPYAQADCLPCLNGGGGQDPAMACPPPSNSCVDYFVAHRPNGVYGIFDFAPLTYDINHNVEIARLGPLGDTVLSTGDLQPEFNAGTRSTIGYVYSPCLRIEGTYFGTYSWEDTAAARNLTTNAQLGAGNLVTILSNFNNTPGLAGNDFVSLSQLSAFNSQELNLRYWIDMPPGPFDFSLTLGARHVSAKENLVFHSEAAAGNPAAGNFDNDLTVFTQNDLWGGQLGFQVAWLQSAHVWFEFDAKGAMFHNNASQSSLYTTTDNVAMTATNFPSTRAQERTAWLGDFTCAYNIQFHPGLVLRLGYQAVFLNGIALSADNIEHDNTRLRLGPARLDDSGEVAYHGPIIGLMYNR